MKIVKENLHWFTVDADIKAFIQSCIVCILSSSGSKVPHRLVQQPHAQCVRDLTHFDFIYVGESHSGHEYIDTGMSSGNPLTVALTNCSIQDAETIDQARILQNLRFSELLESLEKMHKDIDWTLSASRQKAVELHKAKTHVVPYKSTRDYIFVARTHGLRTKMSTNCVGPRWVFRILSDSTVEIELLISNATAVVHVFRVKPNADAFVGTPVQLQEFADLTDLNWYSVDKMKGIREANHLEALVAWKGIPAAEDSWEPLTVMFEDFPSKIREFFKCRRLNPTLRRSHASIGL